MAQLPDIFADCAAGADAAFVVRRIASAMGQGIFESSVRGPVGVLEYEVVKNQLADGC
jgi:hypothetical protein